MSTLEETARSAGLQDMDLLKLVKADVPPALAVTDLRHRFPRAFAKDVRDMTPAEFKAAKAKLLHPAARPPLPENLKKDFSAMTLDEKEAFERFHGIRPGTEERRRRERLRAEQQRRREIER